MERDNRAHSWPGDTLRAHGLQFEKPLTPAYRHAVEKRILASFPVVGNGLFFCFSLCARQFGRQTVACCERSGNVRRPAVMHGIWPPNMT